MLSRSIFFPLFFFFGLLAASLTLWQVFERLSRGIAAIEKQVKAAGYEFAYNDHLGFIHRSVLASYLHLPCRMILECGRGIVTHAILQLPDQHGHRHARICAREAAHRLQEPQL